MRRRNKMADSAPGWAPASAAGYDHLNEAYAAVPAMPDPAEVRDTKFANGLEVILDGLALRLPG